MLVLLLIVLPTASAALILIIRLLRPAFAYHWLVAMLGSLSAWILAWLIHPETPLNLPLANWQPRIFLPISPALLIDSKSWPFLIALTTLTLAAMTTDVARPVVSRSPRYWFDLVAYLLLTSFSMLAVLSGNLLSLLLSWTLLACIQLALRLRWIQDGTVCVPNRTVAPTACRVPQRHAASAASRTCSGAWPCHNRAPKR